MNPMPSRAEALFAEALAQPAGERRAHLAKVCGADADLLALLLAPVAAHQESDTLAP